LEKILEFRNMQEKLLSLGSKVHKNIVPGYVSLPEVATTIITTIMIIDNTAAIIAATILTATDTILCILLTEEIVHCPKISILLGE
jgi:hypothetical protein